LFVPRMFRQTCLTNMFDGLDVNVLFNKRDGREVEAKREGR
jgi:hypothetical protein